MEGQKAPNFFGIPCSREEVEVLGGYGRAGRKAGAHRYELEIRGQMVQDRPGVTHETVIGVRFGLEGNLE